MPRLLTLYDGLRIDTIGKVNRTKHISFSETDMVMNLPTHIEIETSSLCNRRCVWCPNYTHARGTKEEYLSLSIWEKLLAELSLLEYQGRFAFHNYNEPLYDPRIFDLVASARQALPSAYLVLYTNGDLLSEARLRTLMKNGLNEIRVTLYPKNNQIAFSEALAFAKIKKFLSKINPENHFAITNVSAQTKSNEVEHVYLVDNRFPVRIIFPNVTTYSNRGGSVKIEYLNQFRRQETCFRPFHSAAIDYLGNLKLCCQVYDTEAEKNQPYVIGNLAFQSFTSLWNSQKLNQLRQKIQELDFAHLPICQGCTAHTPRDILQIHSQKKEMIPA